MSHSRWSRASLRLAAALVRRARRAKERLFAPDAFEPAVRAALDQVAAVDLRGAVVAITGSSRGVGLALARALAAGGARVVINGRDAARARRAADAIRDAGGTALAVAADVSQPDAAAAFIGRCVAEYGRIDMLVNNAAIAGPVGTAPWDIDPHDWAAVVSADLSGPFYCARAALRWMHAHGVAGRIINVSSGAGRAAAPGMAAYVAAKWGLEGLTRTLALDATGTGIGVCAIELGTLRTDMSRALVRFEDHLHLPPPETVVPVFVHALAAPLEQIAGKVFAAWRFQQDREGEMALARPLAAFKKFAFAPVEHAGRRLDRDAPGVQAFDRAENPLGMPPKVRRLLQECAGTLDFSRYPDPAYPQLRAALAHKLGLPADDFTFAAGSAELVERIVRTFAGCGEDVLANDPTWFMFDRFCAMADVPLRRIPVRQRSPQGAYDHHLDAVAQAVTERTRLIYLISPSNPLGTCLDHDEFGRFLQAVPAHIPIVVDEAYMEFCERPDALRLAEWVRGSDRLLIGLRTFSKFYGLAGLRVGYAYGTPRAIRLLERLEHLFCISSLAHDAAVAALQDTPHAEATHRLLRDEKARIRRVLGEAGLAALPSDTHFMLVQSPLPPARIAELWGAFHDAGIIVPRGLMFDRWLMLPVLQPEQNDRHLHILRAAAQRAEHVAVADA